MEEIKDISTLEDVKQLVDIFYDRIQEDELLAPIFDAAIQDRWPQHMNIMYTFWQTVLLGEHTYFGSPFVPHAKLPIDRIHFETWLGLFDKTVDELFKGPIATEAKWRADKMAIMFETKIKHYQANQFKDLL